MPAPRIYHKVRNLILDQSQTCILLYLHYKLSFILQHAYPIAVLF